MCQANIPESLKHLNGDKVAKVSTKIESFFVKKQ